MLKGDLRKKQILDTAEMLFAERGYEATGVQDILDVLNLSKGSFYHHFESKEQVLQKICEARAERAAGLIHESENGDGLENLNLLLRSFIPFQGEGLTFLKMILPVFILPEGKSVRAGYQEALKACWLPMTEKAVLQMISQREAYTQYPAKTAEMILDLVNDLWAQISQLLIQSGRQKNLDAEQINPGQILSLVEPYRAAIENLLCAPYGSIGLISLEELDQTIRAIHEHMNRTGNCG